MNTCTLCNKEIDKEYIAKMSKLADDHDDNNLTEMIGCAYKYGTVSIHVECGLERANEKFKKYLENKK